MRLVRQRLHGFRNLRPPLKRLFHGKNQIHQQLLFSVDVCMTLGQLHPILANNENNTTREFINRMNNKTFRSNMTFISDHTYIGGTCKAATLTGKHCATIFMMSMIRLRNYTRMELYIALFLVEKTMHYEMILFVFLKMKVIFLSLE